MVRNLYRFYLYFIFIALVVFVVVATGLLLNTLLDLTPLRGSYVTPPAQSAVVQSLVFALVSWIISGSLGGLHYWLIRRDMRSDPVAGTSAIRAFFLNGTELFGTCIVVLTAGFALETRAYSSGSNIISLISSALPTLAMVLLLEWERRRVPTQKGLALVFQRLHLFGAQFFLLLCVLVAFLTTLRPFMYRLFFRGNDSSLSCGYAGCTPPHLAILGLALLWFLLCWLIYSVATFQDTSRNLRMIVHGISLVWGVSLVLLGMFIGFELLLSPLFQINLSLADVLGVGAQDDFVSPLLTGLLVTLVYHLLLRNISKRGLTTPEVRRGTEWAIVAALMGGTFWIGCGYGLYTILQASGHLPGTPNSHDWVMTIALMITGVGYIGLDLSLRQASLHSSGATTGPRRGFVLALLGAAILSFASGCATLLFAWGTYVLGSPIDNWVLIAHTGLAASIIGGIVIGIYLWAVLREHLVGRRNTTDQPAGPFAPTISARPVPPASIEEILDALLAQSLNRDEAARRLHELSYTPLPK